MVHQGHERGCVGMLYQCSLGDLKLDGPVALLRSGLHN